MDVVGLIFGLIAFVIAAGASRKVRELEARLKARGLLDGEKKA